MSWSAQKLHGLWSRLDAQIETLRGACSGGAADTLDRWRAHSAAVSFHLRPRGERPLLVGVFGGTGVGKSAVINHLTGARLTASSFRRTFTKGPVAIAYSEQVIPDGWPGVPTRTADAIPTAGAPGWLTLIPHTGELTRDLTLIDTTDLDGDEPTHHEEADRVFRWIEAALFVVTPEKYQMTEPISYFRLARRYRLPAIFLMNKLEERAVVEDFRSQLAGRDWTDAEVFEIPREDSTYAAGEGWGVEDLETRLHEISREAGGPDRVGLARRLEDLLGRLRDQALEPLRAERAQVDRIGAALEAMIAPQPGLDVGPVTRALQRRLQEQSVLYLMGPRRMIDRLRQAPTALARLPRFMMGWFSSEANERKAEIAQADAMPGQAPDYRAALVDQFKILQARIDDLLRAGPISEAWTRREGAAYTGALIDPEEAGRIADEEMGALRAWLEKRWNESPRDTALLRKLLDKIPGGKKLTAYSEAAPYLLAVVVAAHNAFFGPVDLIILGGYGLASWISEKMSDEVTGRTREANQRLAERFAALAKEQIRRMREWVETQAPPREALDRAARAADQIADEISGLAEES